MRKAFLAAFAVASCLIGQAQLLSVDAPQAVVLPQGLSVNSCNLSPDGTIAVVSPLGGLGLQSLSLNDGTLSAISTTASPYQVSFSNDGTSVVFRDPSQTADMRRYVSLKSYNMDTKTTTTLVPATRNLQGADVQGAVAVAMVNGKISSTSLDGQSAAALRPVLSIDHGSLCITGTDGVTTVLNPLGELCNSYIWESLSPDGTRIAFYGVANGAFTCALDGSDVRPLGHIQAPVWVNDNVLVGMDAQDDGIQNIASTIVAVAADGSQKQVLTDGSQIALFPSACSDKISFVTPSGELFIMNIK